MHCVTSLGKRSKAGNMPLQNDNGDSAYLKAQNALELMFWFFQSTESDLLLLENKILRTFYSEENTSRTLELF